MARVLSISYDPTLTKTRAFALHSAGHNARSVATLRDALRECTTGEDDILLLGNQIPKREKLDIIECFRRYNPKGRVVAYIRSGEHRLTQVDCYVYPGNPDELTRAIAELLAPRPKPRAKRRAAKARTK